MSAAARDPGRGGTHDGSAGSGCNRLPASGRSAEQKQYEKQTSYFHKISAAVFMAAAVTEDYLWSIEEKYSVEIFIMPG